MSETNLKITEALTAYKLLCQIQPRYQRTKYPYDAWDIEGKKITFTQNEIELLVSHTDANKVTGGNELITVYY